MDLNILNDIFYFCSLQVILIDFQVVYCSLCINSRPRLVWPTFLSVPTAVPPGTAQNVGMKIPKVKIIRKIHGNPRRYGKKKKRLTREKSQTKELSEVCEEKLNPILNCFSV